MRRAASRFAAVVLAVSFSAILHAQSLGEIAKKTEQERANDQAGCAKSPPTGSASKSATPSKDSKPAEKGPDQCNPAKSYSNKDLTPVESPATPVQVPVVPSATDPSVHLSGKPTAGAFDGVYKAAKAIQGATESGVSYLRFRELLQTMAGEVAALRDRQLSAADAELFALFQHVLDHYQLSAEIWDMQIKASDNEMWKGEVPVTFPDKPETVAFAGQLASEYHIPVANRIYSPPLAQDAVRYQAVPADSFKIVWAKADEVLEHAAMLYNAGGDER